MYFNIWIAGDCHLLHTQFPRLILPITKCSTHSETSIDAIHLHFMSRLIYSFTFTRNWWFVVPWEINCVISFTYDTTRVSNIGTVDMCLCNQTYICSCTLCLDRSLYFTRTICEFQQCVDLYKCWFKCCFIVLLLKVIVCLQHID